MSLSRSASDRGRAARILAVMGAAVAVVVLALFARGCGSGDKGPVYPARQVKEPDLAKAGSVSGSVTFEGTPPKRYKLDLSDAWCKAHQQGETLDERVVVTPAADGKQGVRDVVVHVAKGLEAWVFDYDRTEKTLDQKNCVYSPHALAVRAYQPIVFTSSDQTAHNVNTRRARQGGFNKTFNAGERFTFQFKEPELGIASVCDIHPWMLAYIHVLDHPYFTVTPEDGSFELKNLPEGPYTLEAFHPTLGTQKAEITISAAAPASQSFVFRK